MSKKLKIKIQPKDKKLLKSSAVKKWVRYAERVVNKIMVTNRKKLIEVFMLGIPVKVYSDGKIEVMNDFYKKKGRDGLDA